MKHKFFLWMFLLICVACSIVTPKLCPVYRGILPAADGPGIATEIRFRTDGTFVRDSHYIGATTGQYQENGTYQISGDLLTLKDAQSTIYYRIEKGQLRQLDADKRVIAEPIGIHYVLVSLDSCV